MHAILKRTYSKSYTVTTGYAVAVCVHIAERIQRTSVNVPVILPKVTFLCMQTPSKVTFYSSYKWAFISQSSPVNKQH